MYECIWHSELSLQCIRLLINDLSLTSLVIDHYLWDRCLDLMHFYTFQIYYMNITS